MYTGTLLYMQLMMEFENQTVGRLLNSSADDHSTQVYVAMGIIHLVIVVIPLLVIVPVVLYYIYRIMKESGVKPGIFLYAVVAFLCVTGPLTHGILTDISIIANVQVYGNCSSPYRISAIRGFLASGIHSIVILTLTLISAVQFSMLHFRFKITLKMVCTAFIFIVVYSIAINSLRFTGTYREIWGPICTQEGGIATITAIILTVATFIIPLIVTVTCSVLTCLKTKNSMVSATGKSMVRSVVVLNTFNITCYVALRVPGLVVYILGKELHKSEQSQETLNQLVVIGQLISDVSYPLTALSILILHSGIRQMAFSCCKKRKAVTITNSANATLTTF